MTDSLQARFSQLAVTAFQGTPGLCGGAPAAWRPASASRLWTLSSVRALPLCGNRRSIHLCHQWALPPHLPPPSVRVHGLRERLGFLARLHPQLHNEHLMLLLAAALAHPVLQALLPRLWQTGLPLLRLLWFCCLSRMTGPMRARTGHWSRSAASACMDAKPGHAAGWTELAAAGPDPGLCLSCCRPALPTACSELWSEE